MTILNHIRNGEIGIVVHGNHHAIVQSILDFDFLSGTERPSVIAILTGNRKSQKFFFGMEEILIPCFKHAGVIPAAMRERAQFLLNLQSGRRALESTVRFFDAFPNALGAHIFAEQVPESHATELIARFSGRYTIVGPSGVGLLVPGHLKLGAIGGTTPLQIAQGCLTTPGAVAVISTSGGMTNEIITALAAAKVGTSFAISIGGERFPMMSLCDALTMAQSDAETKGIAYFGELGGVDEYEIVAMLKEKKLTKPVIAYIAGVIDEAFDERMQFGHAKALAEHHDESARAKRAALQHAGAIVPETFPQFLEELAGLSKTEFRGIVLPTEQLMKRTQSILSTREVSDPQSIPAFVQEGKLVPRGENSFAALALQALLGRPCSATTAAFVENVFELLIDNGGAVSGAVNTMITARAGKDLVSSLAAGLLTIGPRFGGAVNDAARAWLAGVDAGMPASSFVEQKTKEGVLLSGIGHRVYRTGVPDPRVLRLSEFATLLHKHAYYDFARSVEAVTTAKNGALILNVDGVIAALLLDILSECEGFSREELHELVEVEFFNALFVIPRSVGFIAHFIEQKKNDEGLFRLPDEFLFVRKKG